MVNDGGYHHVVHNLRVHRSLTLIQHSLHRIFTQNYSSHLHALLCFGLKGEGRTGLVPVVQVKSCSSFGGAVQPSPLASSPQLQLPSTDSTRPPASAWQARPVATPLPSMRQLSCHHGNKKIFSYILSKSIKISVFIIVETEVLNLGRLYLLSEPACE